MLFTAPIFLYFFLPLVLLLNLLAPRPLKNSLLLIASLVFYIWGEVFYSAVFLFSMAMNYALGILVDRARQHASTPAKGTIIFACAANLALMASFKYANFLTDNLNILLAIVGITPLHLDPVHLPIGISFFTFHAISYQIDIWRGTSRVQRNPIDLGLYLALFPQLIAGPIIRYHDIDTQIENRQASLNDTYFGMRRFVYGLAKKLIIANPLGRVADNIFALPPHELTAPLAWLGAFCYTLQLYFDFSAYSCMAIGLGRMFGFHFLENFNYPYISRSIQEFWRRWHISLSRWFRDYLYIPLGGNRLGETRTYLNLFTVFFLCGLWHGASWNFVVWGLYHGLFLVLERAGLDRFLERLPRLLTHVYTIVVVMIGWVFFRADNLPHALQFIQAMAGFGAESTVRDNVGFYYTREFIAVCSVAVILSLPIWPTLEKWLEPSADKNTSWLFHTGHLSVHLLSSVYIVALGFLCILYVNADTYNPFIYFRF
jgi:alginate O-acetyltransferase complex protein AlgI